MHKTKCNKKTVENGGWLNNIQYYFLLWHKPRDNMQVLLIDARVFDEGCYKGKRAFFFCACSSPVVLA